MVEMALMEGKIMTEQEIINSEAFRAINLLIDKKAEELESWIENFKDRVDRAFMKKGYVNTRVSSESKSRGRKELGAEIYAIKELFDIIEYIQKDEVVISELQRLKLRLLNDYDFTHGDDTEQRKVFQNELENR